MQHVVLHWQGSVDAAASSQAMQLDPEALPYGGPPDPSVGQVDPPGDQVEPQGADANGLSSVDAEARKVPAAGRRCAGKPSVCYSSKPWSACSKQWLVWKLCSALQTGNGLPVSKQHRNPAMPAYTARQTT